MAVLSLKVVDKAENTLCVNSGEDFVDLVHTAEYSDGDRIILESSEKGIHLIVQIDDAMGPAFLYVKDMISYQIPFGEKRICYSPKVFYGSRHYLYARVARTEEMEVYRNLALNPMDQHENASYFPHASANVETRGESVFAAKNAIDGVLANRSHGEWPYQSWGINRQADACMKVEFGKLVETDKVVLYTRADFPHDSWWQQVSLSFSDGSEIIWELEKRTDAHVITFDKKRIEWISLGNLIKAEDESPFPALTQIEVYGVCGTQ